MKFSHFNLSKTL